MVTKVMTWGLGLLAASILYMLELVANGLTNSGLMTPECIMGLVMNLGVGMGEEAELGVCKI